MRYLGARKEQQDYVSVFRVNAGGDLPGSRQTYAVGVLTDGVGGLGHGREAGELVNLSASEAMRAELAAGPTSEEALLAITKKAAITANQSLRDLRIENEYGRCGTTLIIAVIFGRSLVYLSIGDSVILTIDDAGNVAKINQAHILNVGGRRVLASAILGEEIDQVDQGRFDLRRLGTSAVLLSSDGLSGIADDQLKKILISKSKTKLSDIVKIAQTKNSEVQDNLSMILFEIV